jgi:hypothetical protein
MKVLIKVPNSVARTKKIFIDLCLDWEVAHVRKRLSAVIGVPLNCFHLATNRFGITILLTDSWPLSFFISEDNPVLKLKLLEMVRTVRKDSLMSTSMAFHNFSVANFLSSENPSASIMSACKLGNFQLLQDAADLIERENLEEDVFNSVEENKWSPLHYACVSGEVKLVQLLLEKRVNVNKVTIDEWTPLQLASYFGRNEIVSALLDSFSLLINKKTRFRGTALHLACEAGNTEVVKMLLSKGACLNIDDHRGRKPIELAKNEEIFEFWAVYCGKNQLKKYSDNEMPAPFCSEVLMVNSFSLNDKLVFLYLDVENGIINRFSSKEQFMDKMKPEIFIRTIDVQDVRLETRRKNQYGFSIETSKAIMKFYTRFEALTAEWVDRIKKAVEFYMVNKQNGIVEQINEPAEETNEDESTDSTNRVANESESVDFSSFSIMEEIGSGSFGIVYKVSKLNNGQIFAMKSLSKPALQKQKQLKYAISECKIMKQLNHPFIVPLFYAFQTPKYLYLILELCPNGDLLGLLEKKGQIEENVARFYLAEVILALEYLHEADIIYRDLKPANVLIASDFHVKLADFGLAKEKVNKINPAMTMAGSPAYLPPEIVAKKGATAASDIYGLGPLLYELLTGKTPYYSDDIDLLFQNIKIGKLSFPEFVSGHARDFIGSVMNKEPAKRPQISQIKRHPFFRKMDWEALLARRIRPPKLGIEVDG